MKASAISDSKRHSGRQAPRSVFKVTRLRGFSFRYEKRSALVKVVLLLVAILVSLFALTLGDYGISIPQVVAALFGRADDPLAGYFVVDLRLPRILTALLVGAALGVSGAIFQTISRNPLGSPDIIGFTTGAATGALSAIIIFGASPAGTSLGAVIGGLASAILVYLLAWRHGVSGFRLVLIGIGISAVLHAINSLLIVKASLESAQTAEQWRAGSLNGSSWSDLSWILIMLLIGIAISVWVFRPLAALPMGDDMASGLGIRVETTRLVATLAGVLLVALATAACGPISFVALAAPHLARRLSRSAGLSLVAAGLMGSVLVIVSDIIAQRIFAPTQLAVGVITGSLGGCYLVALLAMEWRKKA